MGCAGPRPSLDVFITELGLEASERQADSKSRCGHGSQAGPRAQGSNREVEGSPTGSTGRGREGPRLQAEERRAPCAGGFAESSRGWEAEGRLPGV